MNPQRDIIRAAEQVVLNEFSSPSYAYNALNVNTSGVSPITWVGSDGSGSWAGRFVRATQELQKFGREELQPRREVSQELTNKAQEDRLKRQQMIDSLKERDKVTVNPNYEREKAEWEEKQKQDDLRREAEDKARQEEIKAREARAEERRARIEAIRTVSPDTLVPVQSNQSVEDRFAAASPEERREMIRQLNIDATKARNAPSPAASLPRRVDQPRYGVDSTPRYGDSAVVRADRFFNR